LSPATLFYPRKSLALERFPIGWNHPIGKKTLKINNLEHVLIGKVMQLFRNMLRHLLRRNRNAGRIE